MSERPFVQYRTRFFISKSREKAALDSLKAAPTDASDAVRSARTLTEALGALRWLVHRDAEGNIDGILADDDHFNGMEETELGTLAPFVRSGSSLVLARLGSHDAAPLLFSFDGKKLTVRPLSKRERADPEMMEQPDFVPEAPKDQSPQWPRSGAPPAKRARYAIAATFAPGDWMDHPKFGPGVVVSKLDQDRIRVAFVDGERTLVHGRP